MKIKCFRYIPLLCCRNFQSKGKALNKEEKRNLLKRKKGRVEEKMLKFKAKMDKEESTYTAGPTGGPNKKAKLNTNKIPGLGDVDDYR